MLQSYPHIHFFTYKYPTSIGYFTKDGTPYMEVITGLLEWSYHREDEFGIKMAAYAQFAINKKYGNLQNKEFMRSCRESKLLKYFLDLEGNRSKYWKKYREL